MDLNEVLIEAAKDGNMLVLKAALDKGADINAKDKNGWTALMWASKNGHSEIVNFLKEKGASITVESVAPDIEDKELPNRPDLSWNIIFTRFGQGVMAMASDGSGLKVIYPNGEMPNISNDGNKIVFVSGLRFSNRPLADVDALYYASRIDKGYSITRLPFGAERYINSLPEIYIIDIQQGIYKKLPMNEDIGPSFPKFSPDGKKIAFKGTKEWKCDIWISDVDNWNMYRLTHEESVDYFCWISDEEIFFSTEKGEKYIINTDGSKLEKLTLFEKDDYEPLWSRDGRKIAFCNSNDLYIMDSNGENRRRLTEIKGWIGDWSPDNQWILFASRKMNGNGCDIFVIRVDGKYEMRLTSEYVGDDEIGGDFDPCWFC